MAVEYFISYRRKSGGEVQARLIYDILCKQLGNEEKVFYDIQNICEGEFPEQIKKALGEAKHFILLVNEAFVKEWPIPSIEEDWYYTEIATAIENIGTKNITPVLFDRKFKFSELPEELKRFHCLDKCQTVKYLPEYAEYFGKKVGKHLGINATKEAVYDEYANEYGECFKKIVGDVFNIQIEVHNSGVEKINAENVTIYNNPIPNPVSPTLSAVNYVQLPPLKPRNRIVRRETEITELKRRLDNKRMINMIGIGGCGKSTVSEDFCVKYKNDYDIITGIVINRESYYKKFVDWYREPLGVNFKYVDVEKNGQKTIDYEETYKSVISALDDYQPNKKKLIVIDINETADYKTIGKELNNIFFHGLASWQILVVSRVRMCPRVPWFIIDVTQVDNGVLKNIFFKYLDDDKRVWYDANHFDDEKLSLLFYYLFNLPLLVVQLAYFLNNFKRALSYEEIVEYLKIDHSLFEKYAGQSIPDEDKYDNIGKYLGSLVSFGRLDALSDTNNLLKDIVRHFMLWPSSTAYNLDFVKRFVPGYDGMTIEMGLGHLVDKSILVYKDGKYQMHGLIAESCRKQVFTEEEYKAYRNFDRYLECIDEFDKQYDFKKSDDKEIRSAIIESLLFVIPSDDTYLLRKANKYWEAKFYETALKIKLLKLSGNCISDEAIYKQLHPEVMVDGDKKTLTDEDKRVQQTSADQLYYAWLENESGYSNSIPSDGIVSFKGKDGKPHSFKMIKVDGGEFEMGAQKQDKSKPNYDEEADDRESPVHTVKLSDFYIGETPVTQGLWKAVMGRDNNPSSFDKGNDYPVESVLWYDCLYFIIELNKKTGLKFRFPTEAQWEFAACGGNKYSPYKYSGGKNIEDVAVYWGNSKNDSDNHCSSPVKSKSPNELGIYDMSGNVYEWCQDWYDDYTSGNVDNPTGPSSGSSRVLRGGAWVSIVEDCRVSGRSYDDPDDRSSDCGMRLALPCSPFPS